MHPQSLATLSRACFSSGVRFIISTIPNQNFNCTSIFIKSNNNAIQEITKQKEDIGWRPTSCVKQRAEAGK